MFYFLNVLLVLRFSEVFKFVDADQMRTSQCKWSLAQVCKNCLSLLVDGLELIGGRDSGIFFTRSILCRVSSRVITLLLGTNVEIG